MEALKNGELQVTTSPNSIGNSADRAIWMKLFESDPQPIKGNEPTKE
jgi:hypothetical protein